MERWDSEWAVETTELSQFKSEYIENGGDEDTQFTANTEPSGESGDENNPKSELELSQNKIKNVELAKKRLKAYTNKLQLKTVSAKKEKNEENDKMDKNVIKKSKKDYPDDRAKAVIQEIEEIKKKEAKVAQGIYAEKLKNDHITREAVAAAIKNIKNLAKARDRSRSLSQDKDRHFRKREIKSRNYRRTESYDRRSNSPEERNRKPRRTSSGKNNYPKNWAEYSNEKLTSAKDEKLKSKFFNQKTNSNIELFSKLYKLETPSPILESFKYSTETEMREVPFSHFRVTRSHPKISFSTNFENNKDSFLSRAQLFQIIPNGRRQLIEKLINSAGKCHSTAKPLQTRNWYSRMWKKKDAECKILEKSVGLSFLQNYSDEEEEIDNEEVVICSSTKPINKKEEPNMTLSDIKEIQEKIIVAKIEPTVEEPENELQAQKNDTNEGEEMSKHAAGSKDGVLEEHDEVENPEEKIETERQNFDNQDQNGDEFEPGEIVDDSESMQDDKREYTPEKELLIPKLMKEESILKTKQAIKMLEIELAKRSELTDKKDKSKHRKDSQSNDSTEKRKDDKKKKNKKKATKVEDENTDSDIEEGKKKSKKKKKKLKTKKKDVSDEEEISEDEKKTKKSKKKDKKKEKQKKKISKKEISAKENKTKNKDDESEEDDTKRESKKKKKKRKEESVTKEVQEEKESKKKSKKKKANKRRDESQSSKSSDESADEKPSKKDKSKSKKTKKNKHDAGIEDLLPKIGDDGQDKSGYEETQLISNTHVKKYDKRESKNSETILNDGVVEYTDLRQKLVAKSGKSKDRKSKDKHDEYSVDTRSVEEFKSPKSKDDLRWELLENKRKRKQEEDEEELEAFPLVKDTYFGTPSKNIVSNTPDTDDYSGNWEKDSDGVWESEEELPSKPKEKLNSSWESDEETFERNRGNTDIKSFKESLDLEIPLNIKPFKRRSEPFLDADTELEMLKIESKNLSEERRRLEIEKLKVQELELRMIREMERKTTREQKPAETFEKLKIKEEKHRNTPERDSQKTADRSKKIVEESEPKKKDKADSIMITNTNEDTPPKETPKKISNIVIDLDKIQEKAKMEISKPKRDRWDQRVPSCSTPVKNIVDLTETTTPEKSNERDDVIIISSSTELQETSAVLEDEYEQFIKAVSSDSKEKKGKTSTDVPKKPSVISPKDIPFIPMPNEMKPVPVPSPKLDSNKIPSSLINLSLSANITLDITSKIDSPSRKSVSFVSSPISSPQITPISKTEALVSSSTVDIKQNLIKNEKIDEKLSNIKSIAKLEVPSLDFQIASPLKDNMLLPNNKQENKPEPEIKKPLIFGGMTLPTKKSLLDNSNLKLDDSDEENSNSKLKPLDSTKPEAPVSEEMPILKPEMNIGNRLQDEKLSETTPKEFLGDQSYQKRISRSPQASRYSDSKQATRRDSSPKRSSLSRYPSPPKSSRRHDSPVRRRSSPIRKHGSPRRSPRRRSPSRNDRKSPMRKSPSRSRRSPDRRPLPGKRRYSSRRSPSPTHRRRRGSLSPRRRSPRRSPSPRSFSSKRPRSRSPDKSRTSWKSPERERSSRISIVASLDRLERSVADSTISDDLLPQPSHNSEEYADSTSTGFYDSSSMKMAETSMRVPLGVDYMKEPPPRKMISTPSTYESFSYDQNNQYSHMSQYMNPVKNETSLEEVYQKNQAAVQMPQHSFVQIGNMVEIVPRDLNVKTEFDEGNISQRTKTGHHQEKSQMVQVGNIVQIVPTDFSPAIIKPPKPPLPPLELPKPEEVKDEIVKVELPPPLPTVQEKQSAEEAMQVKIAERKAEREQRRQEKEKKRLEKEKRRKEREMKRQVRMKQKTENMIKRALQLEVAAMAEGEASLDETPVQWPPVPIVSSAVNVGKSILIKGGFSTTNSTKADKNVKFADGVRPGEGTSPSGGEELSSPPPKKILPKEKRYTKTKIKNKNQKKKVKVKIVKKSPTPASSLEIDDNDDEEDNLPPPSPPPGSPPPHIWPPRLKPQILNNIHPSFVMGVQAAPPLPPPLPPPVVSVATSQQSTQFAQQQFQLQHQQQHQLQHQQLQQQQLHQQQHLFNPAVSLLMAPPPPPPHHHHAGPPQPSHHPHQHPHVPHVPPHHGPPPLPPRPPTHHHGPPTPGPPGSHHRSSYHY